jgi:hypothetical protein
MKTFEEKYGVKEDEEIKKFHRNRRMFCIYKDTLYIAESRADYSHASWFLKERWISLKKDNLMNEIVRGYLSNKNEIYFYVGYDFEISLEVERIFFNHLNEMVAKLKLNKDTKFFGGMIKPKVGNKWIPRKKYEKVWKYFHLG